MIRYHNGVRITETSRPDWRYAHTKSLLYAGYTLGEAKHVVHTLVDPDKETEAWPIVRERVNAAIDAASKTLG